MEQSFLRDKIDSTPVVNASLSSLDCAINSLYEIE
jgi:hypothetical protein